MCTPSGSNSGAVTLSSASTRSQTRARIVRDEPHRPAVTPPRRGGQPESAEGMRPADLGRSSTSLPHTAMR